MATSNCCSLLDSEVFVNLIIPEGMIHRHLGEFYETYPIGARLIATPIAFLTGSLKVILFPIICAIGVIVMPILAIIRACSPDKQDAGSPGRRGPGDYLKAWCFCIIGLGASIAFISLTTYHLNLVTSSGLFVGILSISIIIHVYKLVKEPPPPKDIKIQ